ncbi:MAG: glycosyltransferase family 4 protein [Syntrophaceae bacterium]
MTGPGRKSKRIAVVIPKFGLVGGAEQFAGELSSRIAGDPGYEVHVFANKWVPAGDRITFHKVPVITFPRFLTTVSFARFARAQIEKAGAFDIVHTHDRIFRADLFTMHGVPHRYWVREVRRKAMSLFDRATVFVDESLILGGNCSRFAVVSDLVKQTLLEEYPQADEGKVSVVHPGVDIERFQKGKRSRAQTRQSFGVNEGEVLILFVSMNFELKGLDLLMQSVGRLKKLAPEKKFRLLVAGKGNLKKYGRIANELGIGQDVIFAGVVGKEKMAGIYQASDVFSMLSKFDTFGMSVLEAMAASLPVVITDRVGARDLVAGGVNGFLISCQAGPDEVAEKLRIAANNLDAMSENAFRTAEGCTWKETARKTERLYREILEIKSKR